MSDWSTYADAYRLSAQDVAEGNGHAGLYTCKGCGGELKTLEWDGYHRRCLGLDSPDDGLKVKESIRRLHKDTARMLRKMGFAEEAAWHELRS